MSRAPNPYPGKVAIKRAVEAARAAGLDVAGFDILPNGTIKVFDRTIIAAQPKDEFEEWEAAGKLG